MKPVVISFVSLLSPYSHCSLEGLVSNVSACEEGPPQVFTEGFVSNISARGPIPPLPGIVGLGGIIPLVVRILRGLLAGPGNADVHKLLGALRKLPSTYFFSVDGSSTC
jgi:hypothetical protein